MTIADLILAIEAIAPPEAAEPWDRTGLHVGSPTRPLDGPVLLTIDLTPAVLAEAIEIRARAIVAYHPPIWNPLERVTDETATGRVVLGAIEAGIAVYSPHTALDAARGGLTEWLCEGLSHPAGTSEPGVIAGDCRALVPWPARAKDREVKLVTFVPEADLERIRMALGTAGAGGIGNYKLCSFATPGVGTFLPGEDTNPAVGKPGKLEQTPEHRLEMVCSRSSLPLAIETLREFHPYEEPAFDVIPLDAEPERRVGSGRRLMLDQGATLAELAERLKAHLGHCRMHAGAPWDESRKIETIGVVAGAGESMLDDAAREGCELFVTGEMKHHDVMRAHRLGIGVMLAGHTNTERGYLPILAARLNERIPSASFVVSREDRDVLRRI